MQEKYLYIDSRNRLSGQFGNSYSVWLSDTVRGIKYVELVSARIPNTIYNIPNGSNVFQINSTPINLSEGFYSVSSLLSDLSLQSNLVSSNISVSYLQSEGKFIISNTNSFNFQTRLGTVFGFPSNVTITSQVATFANAVYNSTFTGRHFVKSSNVIDLTTTDFVFLDIDQLRDSSMLDSTSNPGSGGNVRRTFGPIPLNVVSGGVKTFTENTDFRLRVEFTPPITSIERLNLSWRDSAGNILNFNGFEDNSVLLRFICL
jgi:hypothetical protein